RGLQATTRVAITVGGPGDDDALRAWLADERLDRALLGRLTVVHAPGPLTPWTRDRALFVRTGEDLRLLVPPEPDPQWVRRHNDWGAVPLLARAIGRSKAIELPLQFDGGDLLLLDDAVVFGANLWAKNASRGYATPAELGRALTAWLGRPAVALGEQDGDVPPYHIAMYLAPVGRRRALVGDPALGRAVTGPRFTPGDLSADDGAVLTADDSTATQAQFDRAAQDLRRHGWRVVRVPVVAFDSRTYLTWTNAVAETGPNGKHVFLPQYAEHAPRAATREARAALRELDQQGASAWAQHGFAVVPIRVAGVWPHHGTIGCLVGVLRRGR
ncbi:MAG: hypothetical protein FJ100_16895, partial [Deltaproteobacteria bacterium]|nr:hypothetical protein [Deltaproteobacteria bacterium]